MSLISIALRYWHTLRHLKPVQFYRRLWFRLYRPRVNSTVLASPPRLARGNWQPPAARAPSMLGSRQFRFLNLEQSLPAHDGWNDAKLDKLWLYNIHYFDDLNARNADQRSAWHQALLQRWVQENPPVSGNGWEPYPTSLRIVNWVKWLAAGNAAPPGMTQSLATQARWLSKRLEWHLLGNHLFANAKALVFVGLFFEGDEPPAWLATGLKIMARELPEQVLADGGNFERSPMYHAIFLEDVLDLVNAAQRWPGLIPDAQVSTWRETAERMLGWLVGMAHPDGEIALFNDAAFGVAPNLAELHSYALRLGIASVIADSIRNPVPQTAWMPDQVRHDDCSHQVLRLTHFPESGYVRLEQDNAVALLDVAPIGPDYLPGHAHADTLSFELSVFDQRVVVNGGTSRYGLGPERLHERGTAAHSTVQVAGLDSSEVWGGFRVARRAYPFDLQILNEPGKLQVACSHDGYTRLNGAPVHRRESVMERGSLRVADAVRGGAHAALARYILHPGMQIAADGANTWQLTLPQGQSLRVKVLAGRARLEPASYAPEFGIVLSTQCLAVELSIGQALVEWLWS
ncbi:MAG: alginate lyase family protein [Alcaligenaceae bacterium]